METTATIIINIIMMMQQVHLSIEKRNLWIFAAMVALLLKGKRAHLYALGRALPGKGTAESRVQKLRRWLSNPRISPEQFLPVYLQVLAPLLAHLPRLTLIIDRTEWQRLGVYINLFLCSVAFKGRSFPLYWMVLPKRGCSSLSDQQALLTPVLTALAAHPLLAPTCKVVLADREFCSPKFAQWIRRRGGRFCLRVKKSYQVSRLDIPVTPISVFFRHCQPGTYYFFTNITLTETTRLEGHLFFYWREDCDEPLALITNLPEAASLTTIYGERMFIETLHRDLKSGGYDLERGRLTDLTRLTRLLVPMALAYIYTVIQGDLVELTEPRSPLKKRRLSLFTQARNLFSDVIDRKPLEVVTIFFRQFFTFLVTLITQPALTNTTSALRKFSQTQRALLQSYKDQ